jgi:hypothetical protein
MARESQLLASAAGQKLGSPAQSQDGLGLFSLKVPELGNDGFLNCLPQRGLL